MLKRIAAAIAALALAFPLSLYAFADDFFITGNYSDSEPPFSFMTNEAVMVYSKTIDTYPDYEYVYAGTDLYVPIYIIDETTGDERIATDKEIKDNDVEISYKSSTSGKFIDNISLIDSKKVKNLGLEPGMYAKIEYADDCRQTGNSYVEFEMLLSVDKRVDQNTKAVLRTRIRNWTEDIEESSIYGVRKPTVFLAKNYSGNATFDFGNNITYAATVKNGEKFYLNLDTTADANITATSAKTYMEFYNFTGDFDTFSSTGSLQIPIDRTKFKDKTSGKTQVYAYEILGDNLKALTGEHLTFDAKKNMLTIQTAALGSYVLSAQPLLKDLPPDEEDDIIFTGYASVSSAAAESGATPYVSTPSSRSAASSSQPPSTQPGYTGPTQPSTGKKTFDLNNDTSGNDYPVIDGIAINAANESAENPLTSDMLPQIIACFGSVAAVAGIRELYREYKFKRK